MTSMYHALLSVPNETSNDSSGVPDGAIGLSPWWST